MVAIKDLVKKVAIQSCAGFKYKNELYTTQEKALEAWRYDQLVKLFPRKNCIYENGYSAGEINNKWDELVAILNADVPVIL